MRSGLAAIFLLATILACGCNGTDERTSGDGAVKGSEPVPAGTDADSKSPPAGENPHRTPFLYQDERGDDGRKKSGPVHAHVLDRTKAEQGIRNVKILRKSSSFFGPENEELDHVPLVSGAAVVEVPLSILKEMKVVPPVKKKKEGEAGEDSIRVQVTSWDGNSLSGDASVEIRLQGETEFGTYRIDMADVRVVTFDPAP